MENNQLIPIEEKGEIVLYQPDDNVRLEVRLQDDTVWLNQQQVMALQQINLRIDAQNDRIARIEGALD